MTSAMKKRGLFMGEDYWNESQRRVTPFDFEDDNEGYAFIKNFKEMKIAQNPDEEEEEIIGWDGKSENVSYSCAKASDAARAPAPATGPAPAPASARPGQTMGRPGQTIASPGRVSAARTTASSATGSGVSSSSDSWSLTDAVTLSSAPAPPDPAQLAAEVAFLRRRLAECRAAAPPAADTARRLTLGEPCPLELYRSLADKRHLLAETVRLGDGDAVLAVVLFLKRSLNRSLFERELRMQPAACEQYVAYLRARGWHEDATDLLTMLGRGEDAAMVKYEAAVKTKGVDQQLRSLRNCLQTHFSSDPDLATQAGHIRQHIDLLERQRPVEAADAIDGKLVGRSVLTTLYYFCVHHYMEPVNHLASPLALRERHQLTDKQYVWTVLRARASQHAWSDVEALFTSKSWYSSSGKLRAIVPFDSVTEVLEQHGAPPDVLGIYVSSIDGTDKRLSVAKKCGCFRIVVDTYVAQKDRQALERYRSSVPPDVPGYKYASDALRAATVRWKD